MSTVYLVYHEWLTASSPDLDAPPVVVKAALTSSRAQEWIDSQSFNRTVERYWIEPIDLLA